MDASVALVTTLGAIAVALVSVGAGTIIIMLLIVLAAGCAGVLVAHVIRRRRR